MGFFWNLFMAGAVFLREAHAWRHHHWRFRVEAATWPRDASSTSALLFCLRGEGGVRTTGAFCMKDWRRQSNWHFTFAARTKSTVLQQSATAAGSRSRKRHWSLRVADSRWNAPSRGALCSFICSSRPLHCYPLSWAFFKLASLLRLPLWFVLVVTSW